MAARIPAKGRRRGVLLLLFLLFAGAGVAWAVWWHLVGRWHESTDNAYVAGHVVQVTPQIAGTVTAIGADDTHRVQAGAGGGGGGAGPGGNAPCAGPDPPP